MALSGSGVSSRVTPDRVREQPRDERLPAGRAERGIAEGPVEDDALPGERVEVRGRAPAVSRGPEVEARVIVGDDQEQVRDDLPGRPARISLDPRGPMPGTQRQQARDEGEPEGEPPCGSWPKRIRYNDGCSGSSSQSFRTPAIRHVVGAGEALA